MFADRLVGDADQKWLRQTLMKIVQSNFKFDMTEQEIFDRDVPLLFGNFMNNSNKIGVGVVAAGGASQQQQQHQQA